METAFHIFSHDVGQFRADGIEIMVALDLSGSMRAIDVPPGIRTERELEVAMASGKVKDRLGTAKEEIVGAVFSRFCVGK